MSEDSKLVFLRYINNRIKMDCRYLDGWKAELIRMILDGDNAHKGLAHILACKIDNLPNHIKGELDERI